MSTAKKETTTQTELERLQALMASNPKNARVEVINACRTEAAAKKAAEKAGTDIPATPVTDWRNSPEYKTTKAAPQPTTASKAAGGSTPKTRLADDKARQDAVKEAVKAGHTTAGSVRRYLNEKNIACDTQWIAPLLLGMVAEKAPKVTPPAKKAAPAAKASTTPRKANPVPKAQQLRNNGKAATSKAPAAKAS